MGVGDKLGVTVKGCGVSFQGDNDVPESVVMVAHILMLKTTVLGTLKGVHFMAWIISQYNCYIKIVII